MGIITAIKAARDRVEKGIAFETEQRYWLSESGGGGYAEPFTLEEATDEALWLTGDESRKHSALVLTNSINTVIAVFHDGRAFIPAELLSNQP
jgi:hypothetical protein